MQIFAACTFFRVVGKVLKKIGIEGFDTYRRGNAEHEEKVLEGRKFIRTGKVHWLCRGGDVTRMSCVHAFVRRFVSRPTAPDADS